jgi:hypothetical protein
VDRTEAFKEAIAPIGGPVAASAAIGGPGGPGGAAIGGPLPVTAAPVFTAFTLVFTAFAPVFTAFAPVLAFAPVAAAFAAFSSHFTSYVAGLPAFDFSFIVTPHITIYSTL